LDFGEGLPSFGHAGSSLQDLGSGIVVGLVVTKLLLLLAALLALMFLLLAFLAMVFMIVLKISNKRFDDGAMELAAETQ
jgi:hypothetical protein